MITSTFISPVLTTTERYLHLTNGNLKPAYHKHHPRDANARSGRRPKLRYAFC